jgi:hypothetical protein
MPVEFPTGNVLTMYKPKIYNFFLYQIILDEKIQIRCRVRGRGECMQNGGQET